MQWSPQTFTRKIGFQISTWNFVQRKLSILQVSGIWVPSVTRYEYEWLNQTMSPSKSKEKICRKISVGKYSSEVGSMLLLIMVVNVM